MKFLSWNCRGLGHLQAVVALKELVCKYRPEVIFLIETLVQSTKVEEIKRSIGFEGCLSVDRNGRGCVGLACLWKNNEDASITSFSSNHIDLLVHSQSEDPWHFTGFYGFPERSRRTESWEFLKRLATDHTVPWVIMGDFNDMLSVTEKCGGREHPMRYLDGFRQCINDLQLEEIPMSGGSFTWEKSRGSPQAIFEKLDRAFANQRWLARFSSHTLLNLTASVSDHNPILLHIGDLLQQPNSRRFRFENAWLHEEGLSAVIRRSWELENQDSIVGKISNCAINLAQWSIGLHFQFKQKKKELYRKIAASKRCSETGRQLVDLKTELNTLLLQEEIYWKQRAKSFWLRHGDSNSKYFHAQASSRKRVNTLSVLMNKDGDLISDVDGIHHIVSDYFEHLYSAPQGCDFTAFSDFTPKVSEEDNAMLLAPFSRDEFKIAIDQMHPDKSPGPDGMNPAFYQNFWHIIGEDVVKSCTEWLQQGSFPSTLNHTLISLIPKVGKPVKMTDFRPIALCNVIYKIMAKVLANRLKMILPRIVSETQSAFVPGRLITDNVIVAFELIHHMRRKVRGKFGEVALKLDISKAYDRINWRFLQFMLSKLGFHQKWIDLMMLCVTTVSYNVLVNGKEVGPIFPRRGLRQGDPISPYLFILCVEGLSFLLKEAEARGDIHGIKVVRRAPAISHLLFADDSFLFFRATTSDCEAIKKILIDYEKVSGQEVNRSKSGIFFSNNVDEERANHFRTVLGVMQPLNHSRYLGLPSLIGRNKKEIFAFLVDRIKSRINNWKSRFLSRAGKEILLKSVAQVVPSYCMNVFLLPLGFCDKLQKMMNSFWWGSKADNSSIHWLSWDRMCLPKSKGGMGFRSLHHFNLAMLAKQGWNLLHHPVSLPSLLLKAKYFPKESFLDASVGFNPSFFWRSVLQARELLDVGLKWRVGNGASISVWEDPWLDGGLSRYVQSLVVDGFENLKVRDLMLEEGHGWDEDLIRGLFCEDEVHRILNTPLPRINCNDKLIWRFSSDGLYSVKTGYRAAHEYLLLHGTPITDVPWKNIWHLKIPPKIKDFIWRACRGLLPVCDALLARHLDIDGLCPLCGDYEDLDHALLYCTKSQACWQLVNINVPHNLSFVSFLCQMLQGQTATAELFCSVAWCIWSNRNDVYWKDHNSPAEWIVSKASEFINAWKAARTETNSCVTPTHSHPREVCWIRPPISMVKCNFDASIDDNNHTSSYGAIVRSSNGCALCCFTGYKPGCFAPSVAEAIALRETLRMLLSNQFIDVQVESDCLVLVNAFNSATEGINEFSMIVEECRVLATNFKTFSLRWVSRQVNGVAHHLTKRAASFPNDYVWDSPPTFLVFFY